VAIKIISFVGAKGGIAKSTLAIEVASELARRNCKVAALDADPGQSLAASFWERAQLLPKTANALGARIELYDVVGGQQLGDYVRSVAQDVGDGFLIVDSGPGCIGLLTELGKVSDLCVCPCGPSAHDLDQLGEVKRALYNCPAKQLTVLVRASDDEMTAAIAQRISEKYRPAAETAIAYRQAYAEAHAKGRAALEIDKNAAAEISRLVDEILDILEAGAVPPIKRSKPQGR
jgi:chromosome partitioning protein